MALANRYRRRIVTFSTELEGLIPSYGDLISITHDMPHWGSGGEILSKNDMTLTLSEPVEFEEGQTHYLALRKKNGSLSCPFVVTSGALPTIGWILCYGMLFIINIPHPLTLFGTAFGVIFTITTISQLCGCPVFFSVPNVEPRISADGTRYCAWRKWRTRYWVKGKAKTRC